MMWGAKVKTPVDMPDDMLNQWELCNWLELRFNAPPDGNINKHTTLRPVNSGEALQWAKMVIGYGSCTESWLLRRFQIKGMYDATQRALADAYADVINNLGKAPYAYQIRFFLNTFTMPRNTIADLEVAAVAIVFASVESRFTGVIESPMLMAQHDRGAALPRRKRLHA